MNGASNASPIIVPVTSKEIAINNDKGFLPLAYDILKTFKKYKIKERERTLLVFSHWN